MAKVQKYEFTDETIIYDGHVLHRIKRLDDGVLGGCIEKEANLSQNRGNAWVSYNACVYDDARVYGNAQVLGNVKIFGNAQISNRAIIYDDAQIGGNMVINGDVQIGGNVKLVLDLRLTGDIKMTETIEKFIEDIWQDAPDYKEKDIIKKDEYDEITIDYNKLQDMLDYIGEDLMRCDIFANLNHSEVGRDLRIVIYDNPDAKEFDNFNEKTLEKFIYTFNHFKEIITKGDLVNE